MATTTTETDTERTVREEQEAFDAKQRAARALPDPEPEDEDDEEIDTAAAAAPAPDPDGKKLFDASDYEREDLAIAKVDGNQIDRISLKFAGEVFLDRSSPEDVALYRKLTLGTDVTLMVEGRANGVAVKGATDREGDLDVVVGQRSVKVHTVYVSVADGIDKGGE